MKTLNRIVLGLAFLFCVVFSTNAQNEVHGRITAFETISIAKARIIVRKSKTIVISNSLGEFSIACKKNDKLSIRADGFKSKLVKVKNLTDSINVNLSFGGDEKDMENAIESGHIRRNEMTLAFTKYKDEKFTNLDYESVPRMIEMEFPRVTIVDDIFRMRGKASINANTAVLIFVNGVPSTMNALINMSVEEVSTIKVLMAGETTTYGGGGNGVILITTRIK